MTRSKTAPKRSIPGDGCYLCTGGLADGRGRRRRNPPLRDQRAPSADEQLASMCDCPSCRAGYEGGCYVSIAIAQVSP